LKRKQESFKKLTGMGERQRGIEREREREREEERKIK
jgi:hypothetical protein